MSNFMTATQQPVQIQSAPYQPTVYVVPTATTNSRREQFPAKTACLLATGQIVLGSLIIIFNVTSIILGDYNAYRGLGVICGILATVGGGLGIGASKKKTGCLIISCMVLSILAAVAAGVVILNSSIALARRSYSLYGWYYFPHRDANLALRILSIILAVLEVVCAIWSAVLGCKVTCCNTVPAPSYMAMYQSGGCAQTVMIPAPPVPAGHQGSDGYAVQMAAPPEYSPTVTPPAESKNNYNRF